MSNLLFETKIIDSKNFRKLKPFRTILYILLIFIGFLLVKPRKVTGNNQSLSDMLNLDYSIVLSSFLFFGLMAIILHYYSEKYKKIGNLVINEENIILKTSNDTFIYSLNELKNLSISRGSTFHYEYKEDNYLIKFDNWVSFDFNGELKKIEFSIDSITKNEEFEELIKFLTVKYNDLKYISI